MKIIGTCGVRGLLSFAIAGAALALSGCGASVGAGGSSTAHVARSANDVVAACAMRVAANEVAIQGIRRLPAKTYQAITDYCAMSDAEISRDVQQLKRPTAAAKS